MTDQGDKVGKNKSNFSFHEGMALIKLAGSYPKLVDVIYEAVQNALDSSAVRIVIKLDYKDRVLVVQDNGDGVTLDKFNEALTSVGHSIKRENSLGQFGLGLIAPLGKCEEFTFTSVYKTHTSGYKCWHFVTENIKKSKKVEFIPMSEVSSYVFGSGKKPPYKKTFVWWRTEVRLNKFTADRTISKVDIESLEEGILMRFAEKMRKLNASIFIKIKRQNETEPEETTFSAPEFTGDQLPIIRYDKKMNNESSFQIYLSRKTSSGRKGIVKVGIQLNDYRLDFKTFALAHNMLKPETFEVLASGIFEGEILSRNCLLAKERTHFEENDALVDFCKVIDRWVKEIGMEHYEKINDEKQDERYQKLGVESLKKLDLMFKSPLYKNFQDVLSNIKEGTISPGHTDFKQAKETFSDFNELANHIKNENSAIPKENDGDEKGHQEHRNHNTAAGPRGSRRKIVKHKGVGLRFVYEEMSGKSLLWEFEVKAGLLHFNIRHPLWERAEKKDRLLMRFQEQIAISALTIETMPKDQRLICQQFAYEHINGALFLLEN